jgi:hypothetical protein
MNSKIEAFLRYMLFTEETPLTAPIKGNTAFSKNFAAIGPRDKKGRSLRDFDLQTRLFRFPCSYLIYSEAFDALPAPLKELIYRRLWKILSGENPNFQKPGADTRVAIREILGETKPGLPEYWK